MKNMKISKKLIIGFGSVLLTVVLLISAATFGMLTLNANITTYADQTVPNTNNVWMLRRTLVAVQRDMLMALTENSQSEIKKDLESVASGGDQIYVALDAYEKTEGSDAALIKEMRDELAVAAPARQKMSDLLSLNTEEANAQAYSLFTSTYKPAIDRVGAAAVKAGDIETASANALKASSSTNFTIAFIIIVAASAISVAVTILMVVSITRAIVKPVGEIQSVAKKLSEGDLSVQIKYTGKDELGMMASDIRMLISTIVGIINDLSVGLREMGNGNFNIESEAQHLYVGDFVKLKDSMYTIMNSLSGTLKQISQAADQVSGGSEQVSGGAQALSQGATEQASSIQELSATIAEISNQVKQNAENARSAKQKSELSSVEVEKGNQQMQEMIKAMDDISEKSAEIGKIIKTIDDIAFQTNILALNAAVEAARAGAAGKGFAVVADEVRNLAQKSAEAAKNTTALIEETVNAVENGTQIAGSTAQAMQQVVGGVSDVTSLIVEIAEASNEQANAIIQVTMGVDQISSVVQTNSATAEESAAASEELSSQAQMLKELVSKFKLR